VSDRNAVRALKTTPARKAVAIPEKVPTNRMGIPNVNNRSQRTCVRVTKYNPKILLRIMRYPPAQMNERIRISISM